MPGVLDAHTPALTLVSGQHCQRGNETRSAMLMTMSLAEVMPALHTNTSWTECLLSVLAEFQVVVTETAP